jgi:hypothetical protein
MTHTTLHHQAYERYNIRLNSYDSEYACKEKGQMRGGLFIIGKKAVTNTYKENETLVYGLFCKVKYTF